MTVVTMKIWDENDELKMEATLDNPEAINLPPTAALIFGSYLGAHTEALVEASMHWYKQQVTAPPPDLAPEPPQIFVPPQKEIKL